MKISNGTDKYIKTQYLKWFRLSANRHLEKSAASRIWSRIHQLYYDFRTENVFIILADTERGQPSSATARIWSEQIQKNTPPEQAPRWRPWRKQRPISRIIQPIWPCTVLTNVEKVGCGSTMTEYGRSPNHLMGIVSPSCFFNAQVGINWFL